MQKVEPNGISITYETHGAGHPPLLVTGVGYGAWFWRKVIPSLSKHFHVITFDNRGAGASHKPDGPYTQPMMAGAGMATLSDEKVTERMASIRAPVLILFGEHDKVVPPGNAEPMANKLADATVKILSGMGHIFPIEDPDATAKAIIDWLVISDQFSDH